MSMKRTIPLRGAVYRMAEFSFSTSSDSWNDRLGERIAVTASRCVFCRSAFCHRKPGHGARHIEGEWHCGDRADGQSEEHTSELQTLMHLVCRLLLEKK